MAIFTAIFTAIMTLTLVSGCAAGRAPKKTEPTPVANVQTEKRPLRLTSAQLRPLAHGGELIGARYSMIDNNIMAVANGFSLELEFNDKLNRLSFEQIESLIIIKGPQEVVFTVSQPDPSTPGDTRIINVNVPDSPEGEYELTIAATLAGVNTLPLEAPAVIKIDLDAQTIGEFFLLDSSGLPRPISFEESRMGLSLSDTPKTFVIHFSQAVNQTSVEDSIRSGLKEQPAIASFSWLTPTQLRARLTGLQTGLVYHLALTEAVDARGNGIIGDCAFRAGKASNIGAIDLTTKNMTMIYQFSEERYSAVRSRSVTNRVLLEAGSGLTWAFGVGTRLLSALPLLRYDLAIPQNYREPVWIGLDQLLGYNHSDKTIYIVSVTGNTIDPLFAAPERPLECRLSPNGRVLAIAYRPTQESRKLDLMLVDISQKTLLHHAPAFARPYTTFTGSLAINLTWTGNDSFMFVDDDDIRRAYLSPAGALLDRINTIEKNARIVDYSLTDNLLLYSETGSDGGNLYLAKESKNIRLKNIPFGEKGVYCLIVNDETILFQKDDEIFVYSVSKQEADPVGAGLLLGLSRTGDKAYYMINAEDYGRSSP